MLWFNFKMPRLKHCFFFATIAIALSLLIVGEVLYDFYRPVPFKLDSELGWALKHNFSRTYTQNSLNGAEYKADYSTNEIGLRTHGSIEFAKIKILVLGDSFTGDPYVGNQQMWYSVATDKLVNDTRSGNGEIFVWAGGAGGYGTYQELILLRQLLKLIRPDVFILQFCANDFVNNHADWEDTQIVRSQKFRRPYVDVNGNQSFSTDFISPIWRAPIIGESRLLSFIDRLVLTAQYRYYKGYGPILDPTLKEKFKIESIKITKDLFTAMHKELKTIPAFMVNCDTNLDGVNKSWMDIAISAGFIPLSEPSESVSKNKQSGEIINHIDGGHLNIRGNQIFGEALADKLLNQSPFSTSLNHRKECGRFQIPCQNTVNVR